MDLPVMASHFPAQKDGLDCSCSWMTCNASRIDEGLNLWICRLWHLTFLLKKMVWTALAPG